MFRFVFNILMALIIASCPIRCHAELTDCCCAEESVSTISCATEGCCEENSTPDPENLPETPTKTCKCICSGATMPDHFGLAQDNLWQPMCLPQFSIVQSLSHLTLQLQPPDDWPEATIEGSFNVGRLIRCLHCSLTI